MSCRFRLFCFLGGTESGSQRSEAKGKEGQVGDIRIIYHFSFFRCRLTRRTFKLNYRSRVPVFLFRGGTESGSQRSEAKGKEGEVGNRMYQDFFFFFCFVYRRTF